MSVALDLAQERPRHEEARGEVGAHGLLPASERELPDGHVLAGPDAGDGCAHVDRPERVARLREQAVDVRLDREVGLGDRHPAELVGQRPRALLAAMEVDEDPGALRREGARAGRADAARGAGDDDALAVKSGLDPLRLLRVRVHVISDMEGVAGIVKWEQTTGGEPLYEEGRKLYTRGDQRSRARREGGRRDGDRRHGLPRRRQGLDVQLARRRGPRSGVRVRRPGRVDGVHGVPRAGLRRRALRRDARTRGHARTA